MLKKKNAYTGNFNCIDILFYELSDSCMHGFHLIIFKLFYPSFSHALLLIDSDFHQGEKAFSSNLRYQGITN